MVIAIFVEIKVNFHHEIIFQGGVASKLSLTAFVLISLMECNSQCIKAVRFTN